jgi:Protein kinase domain
VRNNAVKQLSMIKFAALMSTSPGALGSLRGLAHMRSILSNVGVIVVPDQIAMAKAHEAFGPCPELLPEVHRRWLQICAVKADLDALSPTPGSDPGPGSGTSVSWHSGDELPQIQGYQVEALLGRGGMGLVYKARHLRLNRFVALKMPITGAYAGPRERARFKREAEAAASLHHANIVQVHDVGDHQGSFTRSASCSTRGSPGGCRSEARRRPKRSGRFSITSR